jgi:ribose/xylose/arabinose/galactoside ABC-type transport system permease subunit
MARYLSSTMAQATGLELATIAAIAIGGVSLSGGRGTIVGVLLGTLIIGVLDNGLSVMGVGPAYQAIAKGTIIIAAVALNSLRQD